MIHPVEIKLQQALEFRKSQNTYRTLEVYNGIDFCSNDYLGLGRQPLQPNSSHTGLNSGSTGSRLISGQTEFIAEVENDIAKFHGFDTATLFPSGYIANFGLLACLGQKNDLYLSDELVHASLIDGMRLSYANRERFSHNNLDDLQKKLDHFAPHTNGTIFIVTESLFSMDGDQAPLLEMIDICKPYKAALIVDEAHATGLYGSMGSGLVSAFGIQNEIFAAVYTYGKAVGGEGAVIAGSETLRAYLINFCRPFIYSTAPSPYSINIIKSLYDRFQNARTERKNLHKICTYFIDKSRNLSFDNCQWLDSTSPIQGLILKQDGMAKKLAEYLQRNHFAIKAIVSPTVPKGTERLRISLHSHNTIEEIDGLFSAIADFLRETPC